MLQSDNSADEPHAHAYKCYDDEGQEEAIRGNRLRIGADPADSASHKLGNGRQYSCNHRARSNI